MVFIGGPRQSGKTTLAEHLCKQKGVEVDKWYFNWDAAEDRENIMRERFPAGAGPLVLDEIHKYSRWRQVVKGLFDKRGDELQILVTGSARLDYYRRGGDCFRDDIISIAFCPCRAPNCRSRRCPPSRIPRTYGGFPEPFFLQSKKEFGDGAEKIVPGHSG